MSTGCVADACRELQQEPAAGAIGTGLHGFCELGQSQEATDTRQIYDM